MWERLTKPITTFQAFRSGWKDGRTMYRSSSLSIQVAVKLGVDVNEGWCGAYKHLHKRTPLYIYIYIYMWVDICQETGFSSNEQYINVHRYISWKDLGWSVDWCVDGNCRCPPYQICILIIDNKQRSTFPVAFRWDEISISIFFFSQSLSVLFRCTSLI